MSTDHHTEDPAGPRAFGHTIDTEPADLRRQITGAMVEAAANAIADRLGVPRSDWHAPQRREAVRDGLLSAHAMAAENTPESYPRQVRAGDVIGTVYNGPGETLKGGTV